MPTYIRYAESSALEGPFETPEAADTYAADAGCDDSDYSLVDGERLTGSERVSEPRMHFIDVRLQVNNLHPSTNALELLRKALSHFNEENATGATFYLVEA